MDCLADTFSLLHSHATTMEYQWLEWQEMHHIDKYLVLHVSHMANGELSKLLENPPHDGSK